MLIQPSVLATARIALAERAEPATAVSDLITDLQPETSQRICTVTDITQPSLIFLRF